MASGDKRIGTQGDSMPFGTELICVGPLLLLADLSFVVYIPANMGSVRVKKVRSVVTVTVTDSDSVTTIKNSSTSADMTGGTLTIAQNATPATEDSCTIVDDANAIVEAEGYITLDIEGTSVTAGEAVFFIELERCQ